MLALAPFILGLVFGAPLLVAYLSLGDWTRASLVAFAGGGLVGVVIFPLFTVWGVEVNVTGVRFKRVLGSPRFVPWYDIKRIAEAPRSEVLLQAGLLPWREMSVSATMRGHFRIEWENRTYYFPPNDAREFRWAVIEALTQSGAPTSQWPELVSWEPFEITHLSPAPLLATAARVETGNPYQSPQA